MNLPHNVRNGMTTVALLASICLTQCPAIALAADLGSILKGLGEAIQKNAEQQRSSAELGPSAETLKEQNNQQQRARNSLKATKTPPSSSNWTKIYNEGKVRFYYDPALIRQNGLFVTIPYLVDLPVPNEINLLTDGRFPYKSVISVIQYDCSRRSLPPNPERFWATEDHFFFPENMAMGEPMMDPLRRKKELQWIAGMEEPGLRYEGGTDIGQSYFVVKVLNPELKICTNFWKRPEGFEPPKTPPYLQKKPVPACMGNDMWKWQGCKASINRSRLNPHLGTDLIFKTPGRYEGPVTMGSPNGWGTFTFEGGDRAGDMYIGFFSSGNFEGFGTYYHNATNSLKGSKYIGNFRNNLKDGLGTYIFADGRPAEEGIWKEDKLNQPKQIKNFFLDTRKDLPFCQGADATQWTDCFGFLEFDSIQGQALQQPTDTTYAGGFKNGLPDGVGSYFYRRSLDYQGGLKQGKYDGSGTLFRSEDGESYYTGGFADGKKQGQGVSQSSEGLMERYEGDWLNDFMVKGTIYKEKQFTYVGGLKYGKFNGEGTYTPEHIPGGGDPVVKKGFWVDGNLLPAGKTPVDKAEKKKK